MSLAPAPMGIQTPRRVRSALPPSLAALLHALDVRDAASAAHSRRVAALCLSVADVLGLAGPERRTLQLAGLLHDIGKIGVADAILHKPGRLTLDEHLAMQRHPAIGADLVRPLRPELFAIIRAHHENWDSSGYPDGLAGEQIPRLSRIIAVCDSWDAMTTDRSYRRGMDHAFAAQIMGEGAGGQWDAALVDVLLGIVR